MVEAADQQPAHKSRTGVAQGRDRRQQTRGRGRWGEASQEVAGERGKAVGGPGKKLQAGKGRQQAEG